jgi:hypothetical protein
MIAGATICNPAIAAIVREFFTMYGSLIWRNFFVSKAYGPYGRTLIVAPDLTDCQYVPARVEPLSRCAIGTRATVNVDPMTLCCP